MGFVRIGVVTVLLMSFIVVSGQPSGALGVATLETDQQLFPPSYGGVIYRGGMSNNQLTLDQPADGSLQMSDPYVVILAYQLTLGSQNCTGGLGSASCRFGRFLAVHGEEGDDVLVVRHSAWVGAVYVNCGPGYDRAVVSPNTSVDPSCEVVETV
jgi:hypothetical protein